MWLETPSPAPSPINVNVTVSIPPITVPPDAALDTYTGVLAAATLVLAAFTIGLAIIGWRALARQDREIKATEEQLKLAQAEFEVTREQFELTRKDFEARSRAARPILTVSAARPNAQYMTGQVDWMAGSEPALGVKVWGRGPAAYYGGSCGTLPPGRSFPFPTGFPHLAQGILEADWPFPSVLQALALADNERWVGVTWTSSSERDGRYLRHYKVDGDMDEFWGEDAR